jgi:hypothetical protein
MESIVGVKNPYELIQQAGKKKSKRNNRKKRTAYRKNSKAIKKTRKYRK